MSGDLPTDAKVRRLLDAMGLVPMDDPVDDTGFRYAVKGRNGGESLTATQ